MRTLRKRLTCRNRGSSDLNRIAILKVQKRYVDRMQSNGWVFIPSGITEGNCFFVFERFITLQRPSTQEDFDHLAKMEVAYILEWDLYADIKKGRITGDGVRIYDELSARGWVPRSYATGNHSNFSYLCGYSGNYQQAKMVKVFN